MYLIDNNFDVVPLTDFMNHFQFVFSQHLPTGLCGLQRISIRVSFCEAIFLELSKIHLVSSTLV